MAALAAAFEHPAAQLEVVDEVKQALQRATVLPENQEKHERISALANIVSSSFFHLVKSVLVYFCMSTVCPSC